MSADFIAQHKAKHLLAHVLAAAGARTWPGMARGASGETATGFYADFALAQVPPAHALEKLTDTMTAILRDFREFTAVTLPAAEAAELFGKDSWKRQLVDAIIENDSHVQCVQLDGFLDICDCALKTPAELRAVHPEKFLLTSAHRTRWKYREREEFFIRITGELFPAVAPCECCTA
jgi:threonyl-tRNA synthetase